MLVYHPYSTHLCPRYYSYRILLDIERQKTIFAQIYSDLHPECIFLYKFCTNAWICFCFGAAVHINIHTSIARQCVRIIKKSLLGVGVTGTIRTESFVVIFLLDHHFIVVVHLLCALHQELPKAWETEYESGPYWCHIVLNLPYIDHIIYPFKPLCG